MIKRTYFVAFEKFHEDGTGSFSYWHCIASYRSWLPDSDAVLAEAKRKAVELMKDTPGGTLRVTAFNRV
jgi:hypothetical protein